MGEVTIHLLFCCVQNPQKIPWHKQMLKAVARPSSCSGLLQYGGRNYRLLAEVVRGSLDCKPVFRQTPLKTLPVAGSNSCLQHSPGNINNHLHLQIIVKSYFVNLHQKTSICTFNWTVWQMQPKILLHPPPVSAFTNHHWQTIADICSQEICQFNNCLCQQPSPLHLEKPLDNCTMKVYPQPLPQHPGLQL